MTQEKKLEMPNQHISKGLLLNVSQAHNIPTVVHVHSGAQILQIQQVSRLHISIMGVSVMVIFDHIKNIFDDEV